MVGIHFSDRLRSATLLTTMIRTEGRGARRAEVRVLADESDGQILHALLGLVRYGLIERSYARDHREGELLRSDLAEVVTVTVWKPVAAEVETRSAP